MSAVATWANLRALAVLAGAALLLLAPWILSDFALIMLVRILFFGLLTASFAFLAGDLGLVSLTQASFFGIAAYTIAILQVRYCLAFPLPLLAGVALAVAVGALFGVLVIRSRGIYFLMLTLVLGELTWALASQWVTMTNGDTGITGVYPPTLFGVSLETVPAAFYYVELAVAGLVLGGLAALRRAPFGLMLRAVRDSESRMRMLGYPVALLRYAAFVIASFVAAVGGVFFVYFTGLVNPASMSLTPNVETMMASILGGIHSLAGALIGTAILKTLNIVLSGFTDRYLMIMGVLFLLVILFAPMGLVGAARRYGPGLPDLLRGRRASAHAANGRTPASKRDAAKPRNQGGNA